MKIALLSDIHANSVALEAVLADAAAAGTEETWILGDLVALGPDPLGVLQRLDVLPNCHIIRGNTDRYVVTGDRPPPFPVHPGMDEGRLATCLELEGAFAWAQGAVTAAGKYDWLANLPLEWQTTLPDGTRCLCVHASPGRDDGPGVGRDTSPAELRGLMEWCQARLVCVGHTHWPIDRKVDGWHLVNPGSVSNPHPPDLRACYAILEATAEGYRVEHRRVEYDRQQVLAQVEAQKHPAAEFINRHMRGPK